MKTLVVGLGSMGRRRIGVLQSMGVVGEIRGFDVRQDRCEAAEREAGVSAVDDLESALAWAPDVMIVSTPPDYHMIYAHRAAREGIHFFVEASVLDDGIGELRELLAGTNVVGVPSCTMRFHEEIGKVKRLLDAGTIGEAFAVHYHMGQWLPDWHPHEDYRQFYVGQKDTAATREMVCFELVWLSWLFGQPVTVGCFAEKISSLEIDAPDLYQLLVKFGHGATASVMIDVVSRVPYRSLRIIGEHGVVEWSATQRCVRVYRAEFGEWEVIGGASSSYAGGNFAGEDMYRAELDAFYGAILGEGTYPYDFESDQQILAALVAAEQSSESLKFKRVPTAAREAGES